MSVVTIRAHRRYAVSSAIELRRTDGTTMRGLLIELSAHGCRISNLRIEANDAVLEEGEHVTIASDNGFELAGTIRWSRDGLAGIRLNSSLHMRRLAEIRATDPERRWGT